MMAGQERQLYISNEEADWDVQEAYEARNQRLLAMGSAAVKPTAELLLPDSELSNAQLTAKYTRQGSPFAGYEYPATGI
jgi:hypothetical protein